MDRKYENEKGLKRIKNIKFIQKDLKCTILLKVYNLFWEVTLETIVLDEKMEYLYYFNHTK